MKPDRAERLIREAGTIAGLVDLWVEAAKTERTLPTDLPGDVKAVWPLETLRTWAEYADEMTSVRQDPATSRQVTRYDLIAEATLLLSERDRRYVWDAARSAVNRSRGIAWSRVAREQNVATTTFKRRFEAAMWGLWYELLARAN